MKKIFSFAMAALLVSGLASCSKEIDNAGGGIDGESMVTFTVKSQKGNFVTYAIAEGEEWTVNTVDVYAFEGGNLLGTGKLAESTDYEVEKSGTTTTIRVKASWLAPAAGKNVTFYFVGNDAGHVPASVPTSETAFKNLITQELALDGSDHAALITTPLLFSATQTVKLEGRKEIPVQLKRREARFDIVNKYDPASQLVINDITALNTNIAGYLFSTGSGATFTQKHSQAITVPTGAAWVQSQEGTPARDIWTANSVFYLYPTKLGTAAGETEIVINATMGTQTADYTLADASKINIVANSRYKIILDPLSLTFIVSPADYDEGGDLETVTGGDDTFAGFAVTPGAGLAANFTDNTGTGNASVYNFGDNATGNLEVVVNSTYGSQYKVTYAIGDESNVTFAAPNVQSVRTYAGQSTTDTYTIEVPTLKVDDTKAYSIRFEIFSPGGDAKETILFTRGTMSDDDLKNALNGNEELANVVKDAITTTLGKPAEDITPEDLETITTLDVSGTNGPSSLDGIENLPNLTEINAENNSSLTGPIDFSNNTELESINLRNTDVSSIDISGLNNLTELRTGGTKISVIDFESESLKYLSVSTAGSEIAVFEITSIDLSKMPNLETFNLGGAKYDGELNLVHSNIKTFKVQYCAFNNINIDYSGLPALEIVTLAKCTGISNPIDVSMLSNLKEFHCGNELFPTSLDLSKNSNLELLYVNNSTSLENLTLGNHPNLTELRMAGTRLSTLDITGCSTKLTTLNVNNLQLPLTVYVWSGFPTTNPQGQFTQYYATGSTVNFEVK